MSGSGRMKNGQSVEADIHPTDVLIGPLRSHAAVAPVDGKNGWQAGGWIPKELRETVAGH